MNQLLLMTVTIEALKRGDKGEVITRLKISDKGTAAVEK
jgi:hypothetical protein